jgi:hypothetical protein
MSNLGKEFPPDLEDEKQISFLALEKGNEYLFSISSQD